MRRPASPRKRRAVRLLAVAALALAVAGCGLFRRAERPRQPIRRVGPPVAFEMLRDSPDLPILDLRPADEFHGPLGHLMGAVNAPLGELEKRRDVLRLLRPRTFLVYCAENCPRETLQRLRSLGLDDAMHLWGGVTAWRADGYGTVGAGDPADHVDEPRGPKAAPIEAW